MKFTPQIFMLSPFAHSLMQSLITGFGFCFSPRVLEGHKSSEITSPSECVFKDPCSPLLCLCDQ